MKLKIDYSHPLQLPMGLVIWALWFVTVYAAVSLACTYSPVARQAAQLTWINISLLIFTLCVALLQAWLAWQCWRASLAHGAGRAQRQFAARIATAVYTAGAIAVLMNGLPTVLLPPCI
jgi:hypothetical protein